MTADQLELEAINWLVDNGYTNLWGDDVTSLHGVNRWGVMQ